MGRPNPSDIEKDLSVVRAKLEILCAQQVQYEALIKQFEDLRRTVSQEREGLEHRARCLEASRLPINWLANETLGHIFHFYVRRKATSVPSSGPSMSSAVAVSHVCQRWRAVAMSTPHIWGYLDVKYRWCTEMLEAFLTRSLRTPIDLYFQPCSKLDLEDMAQVKNMVRILRPEFIRVRRLEVTSKTPEAILPFAEALNDIPPFPELVSVSLSITAPDPYFPPGSFLARNMPDQSSSILKAPIPSWVRLTQLKLERLPPSDLPSHLFAKLLSLELSYPPRKARSSPRRCDLRMSALRRFLALTTVLEELILNDTSPMLDVFPPDDDSHSGRTPTLPISLSSLKSFAWTFPPPSEIHPFLSHIHAPNLEKLDVWVENPSEACWPTNANLSGVTQPTSRPALIDLLALKDLSFQCPADDSSISSFRKFNLPNLQSLELVNTASDLVTSRRKHTLTDPLPRTFPRVESIFRDPRLIHLTRLTVSHFDFIPEVGRSEGVLGYMPALISLTLEACLGVENLVKVLGERCYLDISGSKDLRRAWQRGVRVCPRLEALSFWDCVDLTIDLLVEVVIARNGEISGAEYGDLEGLCEKDLQVPAPSRRLTKTSKQDATGCDGDSTRSTSLASTSQVMGRVVKPLRRSSRQGADTAGGESWKSKPPQFSVSNAHDITPPAPIVYVGLHHCTLIQESDTHRLRDSGVTDVVWDGQN